MNQHGCKKLYEEYKNKLDEILYRINSGESLTKIAESMEFDREGLANWLDKNGYRKKRKTKMKYSEELLKTAYDMCLKNESITSVAKKLGIDRNSLSKRFYEKYNYKPLADGRKSLNEEYFSEINSISKAYWLGFFLADGYNNRDEHRIEFLQCEKNKDAVQKFKEAVESGHKISQKKWRGFVSWRICIRNKKMSKDLANFGITETKTFDATLPNIDDCYFWSMMRGYFDGNGSISLNKYNLPTVSFITASRILLEQIKEKLSFENIKSYIYETNKGRSPHQNWALFINCKYAVKFLNKSYVDSSNEIRLNRKYKKYLSMLKCRPELKTI